MLANPWLWIMHCFQAKDPENFSVIPLRPLLVENRLNLNTITCGIVITGATAELNHRPGLLERASLAHHLGLIPFTPGQDNPLILCLFRIMEVLKTELIIRDIGILSGLGANLPPEAAMPPK